MANGGSGGFLRRLVLASLLAVLPAACGYQPLYKNAAPGAGGEDKTNVLIPEQKTRLNQIVRDVLLDELARSGIRARQIHKLAIKVRKMTSPFALRRDQSPTRVTVGLRVDYTLTVAGEKKPVISGRYRGQSSYNVLYSDYANLISENAAVERAARLIARELVVRLAVFFSAQPES